MIYLAAGHYPERPGAGFEGFFEHDEAVKWVAAIAAVLADSCVVVPAGSLKSKTAFINKRAAPADIALEVHFNSAMADGAHVGAGCETLFYPDSKPGHDLALVVQAALAEILPPDRGIKEGWYRGDPDRGAYYFLARTSCTALIIEPEFIHRREVIQGARAACSHRLAEVLIAEDSHGRSDVS